MSAVTPRGAGGREARLTLPLNVVQQVLDVLGGLRHGGFGSCPILGDALQARSGCPSASVGHGVAVTLSNGTPTLKN
jgi:hypothetical protein